MHWPWAKLQRSAELEGYLKSSLPTKLSRVTDHRSPCCFQSVTRTTLASCLPSTSTVRRCRDGSGRSTLSTSGVWSLARHLQVMFEATFQGRVEVAAMTQSSSVPRRNCLQSSWQNEMFE